MGKVTDSQLRMLFLILIVLILAATYRFGYMTYVDKTDAVEAESEELRGKISELKSKLLLEKTYREGVELSEGRCLEILSKYGGGNTPEKALMMLVDLQAYAQMKIPSVTFGADANIYYSNAISSNNGLGVFLYQQPLTITYQVSYEGFQKAVEYINTRSERMTIDSVSASYDTLTGELTGTMTLNLYAVYGSVQEYVPPIVGGVEIGIDNIFGTYIVPKTEVTE